jgi:4-hydroxy-tetrahydrodipicolinate synthase
MSLGTVLTAIVTPFDHNQAVDEDAFVDLIRHVAKHGSDGIVVCATTGEPSTLNSEEHLRLVELACQNRPPGCTIIAGAGSNNTRQAVRMTEAVTELGVDAVLSVTPYYNKPNRRGLVAHYREIAAATDRPVILYNVPTRTVIDLPNDFLAELAQIEHVDYVKQANSNNLAPIDGLGVYTGDDDTFARALDLGLCGGILVTSQVAGDLMRQMVDEPARRGEIDATLKELYRAMFITTNPIPVKAALNLLGHRVGEPRLPLVPTDDAETAIIRAALEQLALLQPRESGFSPGRVGDSASASRGF